MWQAPPRPDQRQRPSDQLNDRSCTVLLAPAGIHGDAPPLPWIIDPGLGPHRLRSLLDVYHVVIPPAFYRVAPQALSDLSI